MPRWIYTAIILVNVLMIIPPVLIFQARSVKSRNPRIHLFHDMDHQKRFEEQSYNPLFADGRSMRPPVAGTVARGELHDDDHFFRGRVGDAWANTFPRQVEVTPELIQRGRDRYGIFCTPCHGISGHGDGMVKRRSEALEQTWDVLDVSTEKARGYPVGHLYNIVANGINTMPGYRSQIPDIEDRWAIVAWVRALQFSQSVPIAQLPPAEQGRMYAKPGAPVVDPNGAPGNNTPNDTDPNNNTPNNTDPNNTDPNNTDPNNTDPNSGSRPGGK